MEIGPSDGFHRVRNAFRRFAYIVTWYRPDTVPKAFPRESRVHVLRWVRPFAVAALALGVAGTGPIRAQIIRGQIVDEATQAPIPGAFIVLLDSAGTQRGAVLSGEGGAFILHVPEAGRYRLRAERIGYADMLSGPLRVAQGQTVTYRFGITVKAVDLEGLKVTGKGRCRMSRDVGAETSVLWDEVRKALSIAVWGDQERGVPYQTLLWSRERDFRSLAVSADTVRLSSGYGRTPFASESARSLGAKGFIRKLADGGFMFYGLDAKTLLSDDFLAGHCFRVKKAGRDQKGLVGLGFEPIHRNGPPDIAGTLWVDQKTAELRYLEFKYDKIPMARDLPTKPFGGRMDFRRLGNGDWVVQHWWLRMPQSVVVTLGRVEQHVAFRIREQGGEIRFIGAAGASGAEGRSELSGIVYDSTRGIPLARANVFLTDINRATATDLVGHFQLDDLPAGEHQIAFTHPRADSLGLAVSPRTVVVDPNRYTSVTLAVPRDAACPASATAGGVVGFVDDLHSGEPVPNTEVRITWWNAGKALGSLIRRVAHTDTTDVHGRYLFCGVPLGTEVDVAAVDGPDVDGPIVTLKLEAPGLVWQELLARHPKHPNQ